MSDLAERLIERAREVRTRAHSKYSGYRVGAALRDERGAMHAGCNVENASFPEGVCAETNAIGAMIAAGGREIVCIAIVGGHDVAEACTPCGGCRQRIREFATADTQIVLLDAQGAAHAYTIEELLPRSFVLRPGRPG